ncbi:MAG TPA: TAXI family TRAP transporter solute-binding subunit [Alphaproteobacteria bacterium]|jgi:TRAP transporter TAXI family solute receptor
MTLSRRDFARYAAAGAASAAFGGDALAGFDDKAPITATVTGATARGYPRAVVEGLNAIVRDAYPGSSVTFKPSSPGGGLVQLADGDATLSVSASAPEIRYAVEGKPPFRQVLKGKLAYVMMLNDNQPLHCIMSRDWAAANGVRTFADIAAKKPRLRLNLNEVGNLQATLGGANILMQVHGFGPDDIVKWGGSISRGNSSSAKDAFQDGKVDAFMTAASYPDSQLRDIARTRPTAWLESVPEKLKQAADFWNYRVDVVPKSVYAFLDHDVEALFQWTSMCAATATPEEVVYKYVKAVHESAARARTIHPSLAGMSGEFMARNRSGLPYHPGAERYYREKGLLK